MATNDDWYPHEPSALMNFYQVLATNLPEVAARLEIDAETLERVQANADWLAYWTQKRYEIENYRRALTVYYRNVAWGGNADDNNLAPLLSPSEPPAEVPDGIDFFTRNLRRRILAHPNYTATDGALLNLIKTGAPRDKTDVTAEFRVEKISPNLLRVKFLKQKMDAFRLEIRRRNSEIWTPLAYFTASPAELEVEPSEPGVVEEIQLRGVLMCKNKDVGEPAYQTAIIGGAL